MEVDGRGAGSPPGDHAAGRGLSELVSEPEGGEGALEADQVGVEATGPC